MRSVTEIAFVFDDVFVVCVAVFIISAGVVWKEEFIEVKGLRGVIRNRNNSLDGIASYRIMLWAIATISLIS